VSGPRIAIVDYKMGNLRSVQKGFEHAGVEDVVVTGDPALVEAADGIVLPGVGAFRDAVANLRESGVEEVLRNRIGAGTPFLGICLGMQLLADMGFEDGEWQGLGLVPGTCEKLPGGVKIPHIGWNTVEYPRDSPLFAGIPESTAFYFVHSYRLVPRDESAVIGSTEYGVRFASAVHSGNIYAVQFHPEKSSTMGLALLANFGRLAAERSRA
jgi:glutamine amidotransferase